MANTSRIWQQIGSVVSNIQSIIYSTLTSISGGNATAYNTWKQIPGVNVGVTPITNTKKILLICVMANYCGAVPIYRIKRNGTTIFTATSPSTRQSASFASGHTIGTPLQTAFTYIDSPASTSLQQYTIEMTPITTGTTTYYSNRDNTGAYGSLATLLAVPL